MARSVRVATSRKIVQIACSDCVSEGDIYETLYALCDDGTLWLHQNNMAQGESYWQRVRSVPQASEAD